MTPENNIDSTSGGGARDDLDAQLRSLTGDRYRTETELGRGAMATVLLAQDTELDRQVAVKVLHAHLLSDETHRARFRREAESVAHVDHPGVLEIYDLLADGDQFLAIVMECVTGPSLDELLEASPPICPELASEIAIPLLEALAHIHDRGIVHRDIKPENILLGDDDGRPRLTDFGIAQVVDAASLTDTGSVMGSPAYMSPEAVEGEAVDARSDVFSVGAILYEMVTGTRPFSGRAPATLMRNIAEGRHRRADHLREAVGRRFGDILERFLSTDRQYRPASAQSAADMLDRFVEETVGDDLPRPGAWVDAPTEYASCLQADLPQRLEALADEAIDDGNRSRAVAVTERLDAINPGDIDIGLLLDNLDGSDRGQSEEPDVPENPRRQLSLPVAALVAVVATGMVLGVWWIRSDEAVTDADTEPSVIDTGSAAPGSAAPEAAESFEGVTDVLDDARHTAQGHVNAAESGVRSANHMAERATQVATDADPDDSLPGPTPPFDPPAASTDDGGNDGDGRVVDDPARYELSFQLRPPSATLTVDGREYDAMDALRGIELAEGRHELRVDGPGARPHREVIDVDGDAQREHTVVLDWQDGYILVDVDRDALVWLGNQSTPQRVSAGQPHRLTVGFGRADEVDRRRDVTVRIAPRQDLEDRRQRTVEVRPGSETSLALSLDDNHE